MNQAAEIHVPGYRIERVLGKGGMARVYLATQISLGRSVALKVMSDPETPQFFERFFNEGRCVSRLNHTNLVTIYDIGSGDGFYYIAMEYLTGGDLKSRIAEGIDPDLALKILSRMASCLSYVHGKGVVHRDIKPSNILFRSDGTPVLTDFGIAKLQQIDNDLTITGTILGSPHYLSPEQAQGSRKLDGRSDLYSLGVILYEMLTSRKPYSADSFAATLMAHIREPIPRLPDEYKEFQPVLDKLLAKEPGERFQNGGELNREILKLRNRLKRDQQADEQSPPTPRQNRRRGSALRTLGLIAGAAAILLLSLELMDRIMPPQESVDGAPVATASTTRDKDEFSTRTQGETIGTEGAAENQEAAGTAGAEAPAPAQNTSEANPPVEASPSIQALLEKARERMQTNRLSYPEGDSARDYFNQVLAKEPGNAEARQGLSEVATRYAELAERQVEQQRPLRAQRLVEQGLTIEQDNQRLLALQKQLQSPPEPEQKTARRDKPWTEQVFGQPPPTTDDVFRQLNPRNR